MNPDPAINGFAIWGIDHAAYGPVELPTLVNWIKDERVLADTWVFGQRDNAWKRAADIPELKLSIGVVLGEDGIDIELDGLG